jgi:HEAT repeat protein
LRSLNTLIKQSKKSEFKPDLKVRDALISAMKVDENPAVRREALRALLKYPVDDKIRDGFLFVLSHDTNSGLRVAAINALLDLNIQGKSLDKKILEELNKKAETDDNDYIRLRAASLLREVD